MTMSAGRGAVWAAVWCSLLLGVAPVPGAAEPAFAARVRPLWPELAAAMRGNSWRPGCPVALEELRHVELRHHRFSGEPALGELIVHRDAVAPTVALFADLFRQGFPIERMRRVEHFGSSDDRSMAANNTSAFNCRRVAGTSTWSEHSYGRAVDVNPVQNPSVRGGTVSPPAGRAYLDRRSYRPGMLLGTRPEVAAAKRHGWRWGGDWRAKDYHHLSTTGR
jgi:hypothetical protein